LTIDAYITLAVGNRRGGERVEEQWEWVCRRERVRRGWIAGSG
jgi:hypothetical protein